MEQGTEILTEQIAAESRASKKAHEFPQPASGPVAATRRTPIDWVFVALAATAVTYAFFAGLRTTADFDLGWQMATGRYVLQHHAIPSVDVLSYTAKGQPWIYPPFGGVILYLLLQAGGFAALSWLGAFACAGTTLLATMQRSRAAAALAIVAVPAIAFRTLPRSELFTTLLFAAFLVILWSHYESRRAPLWALPLLMIAWVNLHVGFVAGLAAMGAYLVVEACELPFDERRDPARQRLRSAAPWLAASAIATLANPWGWGIYRAILLQDSAMNLHSRFIGEWTRVHFSSASWLQALSFRDPASADWWILGIAAAAIVITLARLEIGPALVLAVGAYEAVKHLRMQGLFAILVCVVGGVVFTRAIRAISAVAKTAEATGAGSVWTGQGMFLKGARDTKIAEWVMVALLALIAVIRVVDIVSNRYYLFSDQISLFGAGESWWFPEKAADFLLHENLPGNVFGDYNLGGYLTWRIGAKYPDYFDGRFLPFGEALFARHAELLGSPLDAAAWQQEADARGIQTAIFSTARLGGLSNFPLAEDCKSQSWSPVYLDDTAAILVRNLPQNAALIRRLGISCGSAAISSASLASEDTSRSARALRYEALMNRASISYVLSRDQQSSMDIAAAEGIFHDDPDLHLLKAQLAQANGKLDLAESEYRLALQLRPTDSGWFSLAGLLATEKNYEGALASLKEAAALSDEDYDRYRALGRLYLLMNRPADALKEFQEAEALSPFHSGLSGMGADFNARVAEGQASAYKSLGDLGDAVAEQRLAVNFTPESVARWQALADLSAAAGHADESAKARQRARDLAANAPVPAAQPSPEPPPNKP